MRLISKLLLTRVAWRAAAFRADERGVVGVLFALTLLPIVLLTAMTIDYNSGVALKARVQDALDSAVLAGANSSNPSTTAAQRVAAAQQMFNSTIGKDRGSVARVDFAIDATTSKVTATAAVSKESSFGSRFAPAFAATLTASALPTAKLVRALDVVLCVDATGSMYRTLSAVQNNISSFKTNLDAAISTAGYRPFDRTRVRVLYYRDYGGFGVYNFLWPHYYQFSGKDLGDDPAIVASSFYDMASAGDLASFRSFVSTQSAQGGGDLPESGLECLWQAMHSPWTRAGDALSNGAKVTDVFPVISIYTDAGAHPPNFRYSTQNPTYPADMPRNYAQLLAAWNDASVVDQTNRSILFYGDPGVEDDYYFGDTSGWKTVRGWPGFSNPASLTSADNDFIASLAKGIVGTGNVRLTD